jgi:hypothetical protein
MPNYDEDLQAQPMDINDWNRTSSTGLGARPNTRRSLDSGMYGNSKTYNNGSIFDKIKRGIQRYRDSRESQKRIDAKDPLERQLMFEGYGRSYDNRMNLPYFPEIDTKDRDYSIGGRFRRAKQGIEDAFNRFGDMTVFGGPEVDTNPQEPPVPQGPTWGERARESLGNIGSKISNGLRTFADNIRGNNPSMYKGYNWGKDFDEIDRRLGAAVPGEDYRDHGKYEQQSDEYDDDDDLALHSF